MANSLKVEEQEDNDIVFMVKLPEVDDQNLRHIFWSHGNQRKISSDRFRPYNRRDRSSLAITQLKFDDAGHYSAETEDSYGTSSVASINLYVQKRKPELPTFLRRLHDMSVKIGSPARFLVEIESIPSLKITWFHDNQMLRKNDRFNYLEQNRFYCLDVGWSILQDEGHWTCVAENKYGRSVSSAYLTILVPKAYKTPRFVDELKAILGDDGTVSLECKVIGVPTPTLHWYKDGKKIKAGDTFALKADTSDLSSLGTYSCVAKNCLGQAFSSSSVNFRSDEQISSGKSTFLLGPQPKFVRELRSAVTEIESPLTLSCQVVVPPWPKTIDWYNKDGRIAENEKYKLIADGLGTYALDIKNVEMNDDGEWKCVATSFFGIKALTSCCVTVKSPKNYRTPKFLENLKAAMTPEGLVSFECKVVGYPTPQLKWFKDEKELKPGDVYQLTGTNSLGSYCCIARNCMGEVSSVTVLTLEDIQSQLMDEEKLVMFASSQPPYFIKGLSSHELRINEEFRFHVQVSGKPDPNIFWYRDDELIENNERITSYVEAHGNFYLLLKNVKLKDQAEWKCMATNDYGQTVTSCFIKLVIPKHFKRPKFLAELKATLTKEGSVNLDCKVIGVPQPELRWYKDNKCLKSGEMHKIMSSTNGTCSLGMYSCQAVNCMGATISSAFLLAYEEEKENLNKSVKNNNLDILSIITEEQTSQLNNSDKSTSYEEAAGISFSFDGKEVSISLYETPDLTEEEALQIVEMYADELTEQITEQNIVELPSLRFVKEMIQTGNISMEATVIDIHEKEYSNDDDLKTDADVENSMMDDSAFMTINSVISEDEKNNSYFTHNMLKSTQSLSDENLSQNVNKNIFTNVEHDDIPQDLQPHINEKQNSHQKFISTDSEDDSLHEFEKLKTLKRFSTLQTKETQPNHQSVGTDDPIIKINNQYSDELALVLPNPKDLSVLESLCLSISTIELDLDKIQNNLICNENLETATVNSTLIMLNNLLEPVQEIKNVLETVESQLGNENDNLARKSMLDTLSKSINEFRNSVLQLEETNVHENELLSQTSQTILNSIMGPLERISEGMTLIISENFKESNESLSDEIQSETFTHIDSSFICFRSDSQKMIVILHEYTKKIENLQALIIQKRSSFQYDENMLITFDHLNTLVKQITKIRDWSQDMHEICIQNPELGIEYNEDLTNFNCSIIQFMDSNINVVKTALQTTSGLTQFEKFYHDTSLIRDDLETTFNLTSKLSPLTTINYMSKALKTCISSTTNFPKNKCLLQDTLVVNTNCIKSLEDSIEIIINSLDTIGKCSNVQTSYQKKRLLRSFHKLVAPTHYFLQTLQLTEEQIVLNISQKNELTGSQIYTLVNNLSNPLQSLRKETGNILNEFQFHLNEPEFNKVIAQLLMPPLNDIKDNITVFHDLIFNKEPECINTTYLLSSIDNLNPSLSELAESMMRVEETILQDIPIVSDHKLGIKIVIKSVSALVESILNLQMMEDQSTNSILLRLSTPLIEIKRNLEAINDQFYEEDSNKVNIIMLKILSNPFQSLQRELIEVGDTLEGDINSTIKDLQRTILAIQDQVSFEYGDEPATMEYNIMTLQTLTQPMNVLRNYCVAIIQHQQLNSQTQSDSFQKLQQEQVSIINDITTHSTTILANKSESQQSSLKIVHSIPNLLKNYKVLLLNFVNQSQNEFLEHSTKALLQFMHCDINEIPDSSETQELKENLKYIINMLEEVEHLRNSPTHWEYRLEKLSKLTPILSKLSASLKLISRPNSQDNVQCFLAFLQSLNTIRALKENMKHFQSTSNTDSIQLPMLLSFFKSCEHIEMKISSLLSLVEKCTNLTPEFYKNSVNTFAVLNSQLIRLNKCIIDQSMSDDGQKEIPFELSINSFTDLLKSVTEDDDILMHDIQFTIKEGILKELVQLKNDILFNMSLIQSEDEITFSDQSEDVPIEPNPDLMNVCLKSATDEIMKCDKYFTLLNNHEHSQETECIEGINLSLENVFNIVNFIDRNVPVEIDDVQNFEFISTSRTVVLKMLQQIYQIKIMFEEHLTSNTQETKDNASSLLLQNLNDDFDKLKILLIPNLTPTTIQEDLAERQNQKDNHLIFVTDNYNMEENVVDHHVSFTESIEFATIKPNKRDSSLSDSISYSMEEKSIYMDSSSPNSDILSDEKILQPDSITKANMDHFHQIMENEPISKKYVLFNKVQVDNQDYQAVQEITPSEPKAEDLLSMTSNSNECNLMASENGAVSSVFNEVKETTAPKKTICTKVTTEKITNKCQEQSSLNQISIKETNISLTENKTTDGFLKHSLDSPTAMTAEITYVESSMNNSVITEDRIKENDNEDTVVVDGINMEKPFTKVQIKEWDKILVSGKPHNYSLLPSSDVATVLLAQITSNLNNSIATEKLPRENPLENERMHSVDEINTKKSTVKEQSNNKESGIMVSEEQAIGDSSTALITKSTTVKADLNNSITSKKIITEPQEDYLKNNIIDSSDKINFKKLNVKVQINNEESSVLISQKEIIDHLLPPPNNLSTVSIEQTTTVIANLTNSTTTEALIKEPQEDSCTNKKIDVKMNIEKSVINEQMNNEKNNILVLEEKTLGDLTSFTSDSPTALIAETTTITTKLCDNIDIKELENEFPYNEEVNNSELINKFRNCSAEDDDVIPKKQTTGMIYESSVPSTYSCKDQNLKIYKIQNNKTQILESFSEEEISDEFWDANDIECVLECSKNHDHNVEKLLIHNNFSEQDSFDTATDDTEFNLDKFPELEKDSFELNDDLERVNSSIWDTKSLHELNIECEDFDTELETNEIVNALRKSLGDTIVNDFLAEEYNSFALDTMVIENAEMLQNCEHNSQLPHVEVYLKEFCTSTVDNNNMVFDNIQIIPEDEFKITEILHRNMELNSVQFTEIRGASCTMKQNNSVSDIQADKKLKESASNLNEPDSYISNLDTESNIKSNTLHKLIPNLTVEPYVIQTTGELLQNSSTFETNDNDKNTNHVSATVDIANIQIAEKSILEIDVIQTLASNSEMDTNSLQLSSTYGAEVVQDPFIKETVTEISKELPHANNSTTTEGICSTFSEFKADKNITEILTSTALILEEMNSYEKEIMAISIDSNDLEIKPDLIQNSVHICSVENEDETYSTETKTEFLPESKFQVKTQFAKIVGTGMETSQAYEFDLKVTKQLPTIITLPEQNQDLVSLNGDNIHQMDIISDYTGNLASNTSLMKGLIEPCETTTENKLPLGSQLYIENKNTNTKNASLNNVNERKEFVKSVLIDTNAIKIDFASTKNDKTIEDICIPEKRIKPSSELCNETGKTENTNSSSLEEDITVDNVIVELNKTDLLSEDTKTVLVNKESHYQTTNLQIQDNNGKGNVMEITVFGKEGTLKLKQVDSQLCKENLEVCDFKSTAEVLKIDKIQKPKQINVDNIEKDAITHCMAGKDCSGEQVASFKSLCNEEQSLSQEEPDNIKEEDKYEQKFYDFVNTETDLFKQSRIEGHVKPNDTNLDVKICHKIEPTSIMKTNVLVIKDFEVEPISTINSGLEKHEGYTLESIFIGNDNSVSRKKNVEELEKHTNITDMMETEDLKNIQCFGMFEISNENYNSIKNMFIIQNSAHAKEQNLEIEDESITKFKDFQQKTIIHEKAKIRSNENEMEQHIIEICKKDVKVEHVQTKEMCIENEISELREKSIKPVNGLVTQDKFKNGNSRTEQTIHNMKSLNFVPNNIENHKVQQIKESEQICNNKLNIKFDNEPFEAVLYQTMEIPTNIEITEQNQVQITEQDIKIDQLILQEHKDTEIKIFLKEENLIKNKKNIEKLQSSFSNNLNIKLTTMKNEQIIPNESTELIDQGHIDRGSLQNEVKKPIEEWEIYIEDELKTKIDEIPQEHEQKIMKNDSEELKQCKVEVLAKDLNIKQHKVEEYPEKEIIRSNSVNLESKREIISALPITFEKTDGHGIMKLKNEQISHIIDVPNIIDDLCDMNQSQVLVQIKEQEFTKCNDISCTIFPTEQLVVEDNEKENEYEPKVIETTIEIEQSHSSLKEDVCRTEIMDNEIIDLVFGKENIEKFDKIQKFDFDNKYEKLKIVDQLLMKKMGFKNKIIPTTILRKEDIKIIDDLYNEAVILDEVEFQIEQTGQITEVSHPIYNYEEDICKNKITMQVEDQILNTEDESYTEIDKLFVSTPICEQVVVNSNVEEKEQYQINVFEKVIKVEQHQIHVQDIKKNEREEEILSKPVSEIQNIIGLSDKQTNTSDENNHQLPTDEGLQENMETRKAISVVSTQNLSQQMQHDKIFISPKFEKEFEYSNDSMKTSVSSMDNEYEKIIEKFTASIPVESNNTPHFIPEKEDEIQTLVKIKDPLKNSGSILSGINGKLNDAYIENCVKHFDNMSMKKNKLFRMSSENKETDYEKKKLNSAKNTEVIKGRLLKEEKPVWNYQKYFKNKSYDTEMRTKAFQPPPDETGLQVNNQWGNFKRHSMLLSHNDKSIKSRNNEHYNHLNELTQAYSSSIKTDYIIKKSVNHAIKTLPCGYPPNSFVHTDFSLKTEIPTCEKNNDALIKQTAGNYHLHRSYLYPHIHSNTLNQYEVKSLVNNYQYLPPSQSYTGYFSINTRYINSSNLCLKRYSAARNLQKLHSLGNDIILHSHNNIYSSWNKINKNKFPSDDIFLHYGRNRKVCDEANFIRLPYIPKNRLSQQNFSCNSDSYSKYWPVRQKHVNYCICNYCIFHLHTDWSDFDKSVYQLTRQHIPYHHLEDIHYCTRTPDPNLLEASKVLHGYHYNENHYVLYNGKKDRTSQTQTSVPLLIETSKLPDRCHYNEKILNYIQGKITQHSTRILSSRNIHHLYLKYISMDLLTCWKLRDVENVSPQFTYIRFPIDFSEYLHIYTPHYIPGHENKKNYSLRNSYSGFLPSFKNTYTQKTVPIGATVTLHVEAAGNPKPNIEWLKEGKVLHPDSRYKHVEDTDVHTLIIQDVYYNDAGQYQCRVWNKYGVVNTSINVNVITITGLRKGKPPFFITRPCTIMCVNSDSDLSVSFRLSGDPKPKVMWMKGLTDITDTYRSLMETINDYSRLTMKHIQMSDAGTYFIIAKNKYGSDRTFFTLRVNQRSRSLTPVPTYQDNCNKLSLFRPKYYMNNHGVI